MMHVWSSYKHGASLRAFESKENTKKYTTAVLGVPAIVATVIETLQQLVHRPERSGSDCVATVWNYSCRLMLVSWWWNK